MTRHVFQKILLKAEKNYEIVKHLQYMYSWYFQSVPNSNAYLGVSLSIIFEALVKTFFKQHSLRSLTFWGRTGQ